MNTMNNLVYASVHFFCKYIEAWILRGELLKIICAFLLLIDIAKLRFIETVLIYTPTNDV